MIIPKVGGKYTYYREGTDPGPTEYTVLSMGTTTAQLFCHYENCKMGPYDLAGFNASEWSEEKEDLFDKLYLILKS